MAQRILYIEDRIENRQLVQEILAAANFEMIEARDGLSGIELALTEKPALILMDMELPDIDGVNATRRIKANAATADIPIVALTADALPGDREQFLAAGCAGYLAKPVGAQELLDEINLHLM